MQMLQARDTWGFSLVLVVVSKRLEPSSGSERVVFVLTMVKVKGVTAGPIARFGSFKRIEKHSSTEIKKDL